MIQLVSKQQNTVWLSFAQNALTGNYLSRPALTARWQPKERRRVLNYGELQGLVLNCIAPALKLAGLGPGSRLVVSTENCPQAEILMLAANCIGATFVCVRPKSQSMLAHALCDTRDRAQLLVIEDDEALGHLTELVRDGKAEWPTNGVVVLRRGSNNQTAQEHAPPAPVAMPEVLTWEQLATIAAGQKLEFIPDNDLDAEALVIYSSGTTGEEKGIVHTNRSILATFAGIQDRFNLIAGFRLLAILRGYHIFARICERIVPLLVGGHIDLVRDLTEVKREMIWFGPHVIMGVPLVFERMYDRLPHIEICRVRARLHSRLKGQVSRSWDNFRYVLARTMLSLPLRHIQLAVCGGDALRPEIETEFRRFIRPGFGMSEFPVAFAQGPKAEECRLGSVGRPLNGVRVNFDTGVVDDALHPNWGEIILHGEMRMQGYFHSPEATEVVLTPDGGLRTGDVGYVDSDGFVFVTGRVKDGFKLKTGEYVVPVSHEKLIASHPGVRECVIERHPSRLGVVLIAVPKTSLNQAGEQALKESIFAYCQRLRADKEHLDKVGAVPFGLPRDLSHIKIRHEPFGEEDGTRNSVQKLRRPVIRVVEDAFINTASM